MSLDASTELTVAQFLEFLNTHLKQFWVTVAGEVTGRVNRRGAVTYFSLHDAEEEAVLQCMAFNNILDSLGIELQEGMAIKVGGYPEIWERSGGFSFKVFEVLLTGEGALKRQFEMLTKKLEAEGLFSPEYKQPIPNFAKHIGLITAADREAMNDFIAHLAPHGLNVELYDVRVEGARSVEQIVEAIEWFNGNRPDTEILVLTRGGGSLESLQAFNAEAVARAIFASRIPIICGVGHERDVSIADFVADMRASTPTHAAKIISESWERGALELDQQTERLGSGVREHITQTKFFIDATLQQAQSALEGRFAELDQALTEHSKKLTLGNPELKLKQGYSIIRNGEQRVVKSLAQMREGDIVEAQFHHGKGKLQFQKGV